MSTAMKSAGAGPLGRAAGQRQPATPVGTHSRRERAAVAVDLGGGLARIWAVGHGACAAPTAGEAASRPTPLLHRGRVVDEAKCAALLIRLARSYPESLLAGPVVVACRPVLASPEDQDAIRRVVATAFAPSRVLLIDTVRAAAIGSGAAAGVLLMVDVGAELTEVALLVDGRVAAARRVEVGTRDSASAGLPHRLAGVVTRLVGDIGRDPHVRRLTTAALGRGLVVVGDGATRPELTSRLAANLRVPVRSAASPRIGALSGAGLAAMAACRHPANAAA
jgi:rod shape-determining protein MreB